MKLVRLLVLMAVLTLALSVSGVAQAATDPVWQAAYWPNDSLTGAATLYQAENEIYHDWGSGGPGASFPTDNFSARWVRNVEFSAGTYRFYALSDDGMRVFLNGQKIIDDWGPHAQQLTYVDKTLTAGRYYIQVEYREVSGVAAARFYWTAAPTGSGPWLAEYFNNKNVSGIPLAVQNADKVDFNWGSGSPASQIPVDGFSARFTRTLTLSPGTYLFEMSTDDGGRLWVNGQLVIDAWKNQEVTRYTATVNVPGGSTTLRMDYYEAVGAAVAKLSWTLQGTPTTGTPQAPTGESAIYDNGAYLWLSGGPRADWTVVNVGYGGNALTTPNSDSERRDYNWARWFNSAPKAGRQEVFVYIPDLPNLTTHARYWVRTYSGYTKVIVDQRANVGKWVSLGTYNFRGYTWEFVSLSDVSEEPDRTTTVVWDAVMLSPR